MMSASREIMATFRLISMAFAALALLICIHCIVTINSIDAVDRLRMLGTGAWIGLAFINVLTLSLNAFMFLKEVYKK